MPDEVSWLSEGDGSTMTQQNSSTSVWRKIDRLIENPSAKLRVLDLFAGCGGISLGFHSAGFEIVAALEVDELAAKSHAMNFCKGASDEKIDLHSRARDITKTDPEEYVDELGLGSPQDVFDVIVGGPPCQAYARVGRAKLREVAEHPEAFKVDPRANLYLRYLDYASKLQPLAILMENVPDIMNFGGHNIAEEIVEVLDKMGYEARYSLINSSHHGVPQMRDRVFLIAFRKELNAVIRFPEATHYCDLPRGYEGTRAVALKRIDQNGKTGYVRPNIGHKGLPAAVTTKEALHDLPPITLHKEGKLKRGARRFTELLKYRNIPLSDLSAYAQQQRTWPGFEGVEGVYDHVLRCLPRDTPIFERMRQGDEYPAALKAANELFELEARHRGFQRDSEEWNTLHRQMVPPYPVGSFPNRWWKLREDGPSRTLMAHIGKDTYSHIHYDDFQGRVITPREAARLQSFPDGFVFAGTMNPAFRQIGNAVPPVMAMKIAEQISASLIKALADIRQSTAAE